MYKQLYKKKVIGNIDIQPLQQDNSINQKAQAEINTTKQVENLLDNLIDYKINLNNINNLNVLDNSMRELYNTYQADPLRLEKEFKNNINKLTDGIINLGEKQYLFQHYLKTKDNYIQKAQSNFNTFQDTQLKRNLDLNIYNKIENDKIFFENLFNNRISKEQYLDYLNDSKEMEAKLLNTINSKGEYLYNIKDIQAIKHEYSRIKIEAGHNYFDDLITNYINGRNLTEQEFKNNKYVKELDYWTYNPQIIKDKYNINEYEYQAILRNQRKVKEIINKEIKNNSSNGNLGNSLDEELIADLTKMGELDIQNKNIKIISSVNEEEDKDNIKNHINDNYDKIRDAIDNNINFKELYNKNLQEGKLKKKSVKYSNMLQKNINKVIQNYTINKNLINMYNKKKHFWNDEYENIYTELYNDNDINNINNTNNKVNIIYDMLEEMNSYDYKSIKNDYLNTYKSIKNKVLSKYGLLGKTQEETKLNIENNNINYIEQIRSNTFNFNHNQEIINKLDFE